MIEFKFLGLDGDINEGQITQIYVKIGDDIKKGQDLFELEADKLSQAIVAEFDGKIGQINFEVGDIY
ncbi:biotin/lipoyl-containing protein [Spiroplasma endosymbiont of Asaphidion curtum]|uniref:biotin/lipoyl-containing protein n=1 Tax=Spiroplasma endosymbiont of Asaphidion curtum TaxID=3066281 RepID=UPI00313E5936